MSAPNFFLGLRARLGPLLISLGFGPAIVRVPGVIVGPCMTGRLGDPVLLGALDDPALAGELFAFPSVAGRLGDLAVVGALEDPVIEGVTVNVC